MIFSDAAMRCWSVAAALLGWRPGEFWSATPVELAASLAPPSEAGEPMPSELLSELRQRFPD